MTDPGASDRRDPEGSVPRYPPPQYPPPSASQQGMPPPPPQPVNVPPQPAYYPAAPVYQQTQAQVTAPSAHWPLSIVAVVMCWIVGVVAIYFSYQVGERARAGNLAGAAQASKMARLWAWIAIGIGVLVILAYLGSTQSSSGY